MGVVWRGRSLGGTISCEGLLCSVVLQVRSDFVDEQLADQLKHPKNDGKQKANCNLMETIPNLRCLQWCGPTTNRCRSQLTFEIVQENAVCSFVLVRCFQHHLCDSRARCGRAKKSWREGMEWRQFCWDQ